MMISLLGNIMSEILEFTNYVDGHSVYKSKIDRYVQLRKLLGSEYSALVEKGCMLGDFGCGLLDPTLGLIKTNIQSGGSVHLLDNNKVRLELCKKKLSKTGYSNKLNFFLENAEVFFPDVKYDLMIFSHLLYYLNVDYKTYVSKVLNHLNPFGQAIFILRSNNTPVWENMSKIMDEFRLLSDYSAYSFAETIDIPEPDTKCEVIYSMNIDNCSDNELITIFCFLNRIFFVSQNLADSIVEFWRTGTKKVEFHDIVFTYKNLKAND